MCGSDVYLNVAVIILHCRYTLRNAEYRLCLERNFDTDEDATDKQTTEDSKSEALRTLLHNNIITNIPSGQDELHRYEKVGENASKIPDLGQMTPEVQQYILKLQSRLFSVKKVKTALIFTKLGFSLHYFNILG